MADLVEVLIEDQRWRDHNIDKLAEKSCVAVLKRLGIDPDAFEISLLACDDPHITTLNSEFRGKSDATNVLSWPAFDLAAEIAGGQPNAPRPDPHETPTGLGDIAVAFDTCAREAKQQNLKLNDHITHLLVHGCLHLLGYDHEFEKDALIMEGLEVNILELLGVTDPY